METAERKQIDASLLWEIFDLHARVGTLLRSEYDGLKGYELAALLDLCSSKEPPSIGDIADALGVTSQYASSVLARLVEQGYVEISEGEEDKRCKVVYLTDRGKELCNSRFDKLCGPSSPFTTGKEQDDLRALRAVRVQVDRAIDAFEAEHVGRRWG